MGKSMERRTFLQGLTVGSFALAGAGLIGCGQEGKAGASLETSEESSTSSLATGVPSSWDAECDVLVVGSGYAGLSAAFEATEAGAEVMVIEKLNTVGGNSAIADGDFAVCMSQAQSDQGIEDSVETYVGDMLKAGLNLNDAEKCQLIAEKSNETWEWTRDVLGTEWDVTEDGELNILPYGGHSINRVLHPAEGHGHAMTAPLVELLSERGVEVTTQHMLVGLIRDETGRVVGIEASKDVADGDATTGTPLFVKANRAVVLASGGFGYDVEWRRQHDPRFDEEVDCTNKIGATSESLCTAISSGALPVHLDWIQLGPWCSPDEPGYGKGPSYIDANVAYAPSIDPNTGKRIVNELADRRVYSEAIIANGVPLIQVVDEQNIPKWNFDANLQPAIEAGITWEMNSLEEIAEKFSIPLDGLQETMTRYNSFVEAGVDEDFGKTIPDDAKPVTTPPYYVTRIWPKVHHTMGGVKTNLDAQVIDVNLNPIPGLFAAGEVTGGVHGACRLGACATADCLVNGRIAGQNAAASEPAV